MPIVYSGSKYFGEYSETRFYNEASELSMNKSRGSIDDFVSKNFALIFFIH